VPNIDPDAFESPNDSRASSATADGTHHASCWLYGSLRERSFSRFQAQEAGAPF